MRAVRAFILVAILSFSHSANALKVQWPISQGGNDHYYEVIVSGEISWSKAQEAALAAGGYLATITSAQENTFVADLLVDPDYWNGGTWGPWLGGMLVGDRWMWVNNEDLTYASWHPGEPNNWQSVGEDRIHYYCYSGGEQRCELWNDRPDFYDWNPVAYVVEYE